MKRPRRFFARLIAALLGRRDDERIREEMDDHVALLTDANLRAGASPVEARRQARLTLGAPEAIMEQYRDEQRLRLFEDLWQDLRYALRMLRRSPGFSVVALLSLGLGIGASTAMFQLLDAVRLRDLPVPSPAQLRSVEIGGDGPSGNFTARYSDLSSAQWEQIERRQQAFSTIAAWSSRGFNLADGGEVRMVEGMYVSGTFFEMLGIGPWRGRLFTPADDRPECAAAVAVISHRFWQRELAEDPGAVGKPLRVDGHTFTIAGITPAPFFGIEVGRAYDIAIPLCAEQRLAGTNSQLTVHKHNYWMSAIGRLRDGWTAEQADAHLRAISAQIFMASLPAGAPADNAERYKAMWLRTVAAGKGLSWLRLEYEQSLWLLLASAGLVLLIVCGNLANLLLARAGARAPEIAVRLALGASKARVVRQLLTENLLLACGATVLGLFVASLASAALVSLLVTADNPVALDVATDWRALAFSVAVALSTCVTFGLVPALRTATSVRSGTKTVAGSRGRSVLTRGLVAVQVTLCIVLVAAGMIFGRTLHNLLTAELGFRPEPVLVTSVDTRRLGFDDARQKVLFGALLDQLQATPGVHAAAQSNIVPTSGWESNSTLTMDEGRRVSVRTSSVSPGYFATIGATLLAGRDFGPFDREQTETVAIVNEAFVQTFLPGPSAIGRTFRLDTHTPVRIVGLVQNTKYRSLREEFQPIAFFSTAQITSTFNYARYVVRSTLPWTEVIPSIRASIASVSPSINVQFIPLATQIQQSEVRARLLAALGGGFGLLAGLLAALGIHGLLSYSVEARRHELGIRLALGAARGTIAGLVVRETAWPLVIGVVVGLAITVAARQAAATLVYGLAPNDPVTLAATAVTVVMIGLASAYAPARRAATIDPVTSIREA